jgi:hypothetical protein
VASGVYFLHIAVNEHCAGKRLFKDVKKNDNDEIREYD